MSEDNLEEFYTDPIVLEIIRKITIDLNDLKFDSSYYDNSFFTRSMSPGKEGFYRMEFAIEVCSDIIKIENESGYIIAQIPISSDNWEDVYYHFIEDYRPSIKKYYNDE